MFLSPFLTDYDPELAGDTYLDPMGTLIVWSAFGQQVFPINAGRIAEFSGSHT